MRPFIDIAQFYNGVSDVLNQRADIISLMKETKKPEKIQMFIDETEKFQVVRNGIKYLDITEEEMRENPVHRILHFTQGEIFRLFYRNDDGSFRFLDSIDDWKEVYLNKDNIMDSYDINISDCYLGISRWRDPLNPVARMNFMLNIATLEPSHIHDVTLDFSDIPFMLQEIYPEHQVTPENVHTINTDTIIRDIMDRKDAVLKQYNDLLEFIHFSYEKIPETVLFLQKYNQSTSMKEYKHLITEH